MSSIKKNPSTSDNSKKYETKRQKEESSYPIYVTITGMKPKTHVQERNVLEIQLPKGKRIVSVSDALPESGKMTVKQRNRINVDLWEFKKKIPLSLFEKLIITISVLYQASLLYVYDERCDILVLGFLLSVYRLYGSVLDSSDLHSFLILLDAA